MTGPLVVGVTELLRHPGTQREIDVSAELPGIAVSSAEVPDDGEITARLTLEAMSDHAITVKGTISAPWTGDCRRCLQPVEGTVAMDVEEVFDARPVEGEMYRLDSDRANLEPLFRDAILLALPLAPLCAATCPGPEPEQHPLGAEETPEVDPRWAALAELKFEDDTGTR